MSDSSSIAPIFDFDATFKSKPVVLAPMEDVSDAVFRGLCRSRGADLCFTEFVNVEGLLRGCKQAAFKMDLHEKDHPTVIQIYGADAERLAEAAEVAEDAKPVYLDINCGCWVPKIARRGAGAGWLRNPEKMVEMAKMVVARTKIPVTVKTRIGYGPESEMPILELSKRLEDVGVRALTIHCRTANMGHSGNADWTWAKRAKEGVKIPILVNGDVRTAQDAKEAIESTGCEGVMVGRRSIEHPWIFREARHLLDTGEELAPPTIIERIDLCLEHFRLQREERGDFRTPRSMRRYYPGYLHGMKGAANLRRKLNEENDANAVEALFERLRERALIEGEETDLGQDYPAAA